MKKHTAPLRLGIIGTGGMANAHAENFLKIDGVVLASCLDVLPERAHAFATKHGIAHTTTELKKLLAEVDAVTIVTPDAYHAATSLAALKAGKHVLCEKPLTVTMAEAKKLAAASKRALKANGQITMVNFSYRRSAAMQQAMILAKSGALGDLRHVHAHYLQGWLTTLREPKDGIVPWRLQTKTGGGVLGDLGCHILDLTTSVTGPIKRVRCAYGNFPKISTSGKRFTAFNKQKLDANDTAIIELEFTAGGLGVIHTTRWATGRGNTIRVEAHGTGGAVMFDLDRSYEQLDSFDLAAGKWNTETLAPAPDIYQRFVTSIRDGKQDQPDFVRGAQIQALLDACAKSAKNGKWVAVPVIK